MHPNASGCIRTYPNASERIRTGPNRSKQVRKPLKTCENLKKILNFFANACLTFKFEGVCWSTTAIRKACVIVWLHPAVRDGVSADARDEFQIDSLKVFLRYFLFTQFFLRKQFFVTQKICLRICFSQKNCFTQFVFNNLFHEKKIRKKFFTQKLFYAEKN